MDAHAVAPSGADVGTHDRFGNPHAPALPYARGQILTSTEDDFRKLRQAWRYLSARIDAHGPEGVYNCSGLEHGLPLSANELPVASDFVAPALYFDRFRQAALEHMSGTPEQHDAALFNRITGATYSTHLALVQPGDTVIAVSASYSHPSVLRAAAHVGATLVDTAGLAEFEAALDREHRVALVVITRLAVTYETMPQTDLERVIQLAKARDIPVYVDDAGGARVGPALFDQPGMLELGADLVATGLDKYGTSGPRLGVLTGKKSLVSRIRARGFEMGMEARPLLYPAAYRSLAESTPERVQQLHATSRAVAGSLREILGDRLHETPVISELLADDILEIAMERAGLTSPPIVPFEASAVLALLLVRDYGVLSVHLVGVPPGTAALMFKFISPEVLERFGGPDAFARAVDDCLNKLAELVDDPSAVSEFLFGREVAS